MNDVKKIQIEYVELINSYFGGIKHHLGQSLDSHIDFGYNMAKYPLISDLILDAIDDLGDEINTFWSKYTKNIFDFCNQESTLKCLYSGDITPVILENFVKKSALYLDTVIIADPILNLTFMQKNLIDDKKYYLNKLLRHVFNIFKMKEILTSKSDENIIWVLPTTIQMVDENDKKILFGHANSNFVIYFNTLFGQNFQDIKECFGFAEQLTNSDQILAIVKNIECLPNEFKDKNRLSIFLDKFRMPEGSINAPDKSFGWDFCLYIHSQFIRVQEHKYFCERINAEPIYDYELPWFWFNYEVGGLNMDAAIANSLQQDQFKWITKVPLEAINVFREENKLEYMRSLLRNSLHDIKTRKDDVSLSHTCEQIEKNLNEAFKRQQEEIIELEFAVKEIVKKEIPITTGGCLAGLIPVLGNIISFLSAGRDIKNHLEKRKKAKFEIDYRKNNFINLLFKSYE